MSQMVSSRWYPTLQNSHNVAVQFAIYTSGCQTLLYQSPVFVNNVPGDLTSIQAGVYAGQYPNVALVGGSVTMEKQSAQRSRVSMNIVDTSGLLLRSGVLAPWGNELRVYRGLHYRDGSTEMILLGTFRITDVVPSDDGSGVVRIAIKGTDRSRIVSRVTVWNYYYQTGVSQPYTDAIRQMVQYCYPGVIFNDTAAAWQAQVPAGIGTATGGQSANMIYTPSIYGITFQEGDDLWNESTNMAHAVACDLYFDRYGVLTLKQDPNLNYMNGTLPGIATPVYTFIEGETATFITNQQTLSDANAYSQVIITGIGNVLTYSTSPLRSTPAVDNDPNSPTYINGPYGTVTYQETNDLMTTVPQINLYAQFKLATMSGKQQTLQLTNFVDPSLDIDDPISVTRTRMGIVNQGFIIDSINTPLSASETQTITTRARRAFTYASIH